MARKNAPLKSRDVPEFVGQIIDIFEDFLDERNISLDNPERDDLNVDPDGAATIYGSDYGELCSAIEDTLILWGLVGGGESV